MFNLLLNLSTDFKFFYYYSFKLYNFYLAPLHICYVIVIVSNALPKFSALIFITLNTVSQSDKLQSIFDSLRRQGVKC